MGNSSVTGEFPINKNLTFLSSRNLTFLLWYYIDKNSIVIETTLNYLYNDIPLHVRPLFLYELPFDLRVDLMWGRLVIMVSMNLGKIVEALRCIDGISVKVPNSKKEFSDFFIPITYNETLADKSVISIHGGNLHEIAAKSLFEFMSLEGFVESVRQTIAAILRIAKTSV